LPSSSLSFFPSFYFFFLLFFHRVLLCSQTTSSLRSSCLSLLSTGIIGKCDRCVDKHLLF
jgi:hypothetical protein